MTQKASTFEVEKAAALATSESSTTTTQGGVTVSSSAPASAALFPAPADPRAWPLELVVRNAASGDAFFDTYTRRFLDCRDDVAAATNCLLLSIPRQVVECVAARNRAHRTIALPRDTSAAAPNTSRPNSRRDARCWERQR